MAHKVTKKDKDKDVIVVKTKADKTPSGKPGQWWLAEDDKEMCSKVLGTVSFLKEQQQYRYRQASLYARLYSNYPLYGWAGSNMTKMSLSNQLPSDRPTLNVIQSCIDTLVSRITQSRPRPMFLTDDGDYKQRKLSKQLNDFIQGEFYQTKAYELLGQCFKDSLVEGTGVLKVFEKDDKVTVERRLLTELLIDPNDGMYGSPRQMYEVALVDRSVLAEMFPKYKSEISKAEQAYPDAAESTKTISDQILVVEAWRLPSSKDSDDGKHVICCTEGPILKEEFTKQKFPFVMSHYSKRMLGFWSQGLAEQLMGTQTQINQMLITASTSINLSGVPRVWLEEGAKVVKAHINNQVGMIGTYRGTIPHFQEGTTGLSADYFQHLQRLVDYAYQQSGISAMAAASQKPAGLNSGEAIRNFDDIQSDRFAYTQKNYSSCSEELAEQIFDRACDIADRTGKYQTVYPNKNGAKEIDLPNIKKLKENPFVIQSFDVSSLPKDPAGRLQKITEMIQSGMIDIREGRRLLDYPDLAQNERLANAGEERILQILDAIVEEGKYTPPDPFMDLDLAKTLSVQYYNLYVACKLEEEKAEMLRTFNSQVIAMVTEAMQPPPMPGGLPQQGNPQAQPQPLPVSDMMPRGAA